MHYEHGGDVFDKEVKIDFSVNVNPYGMPASVKNAAIKSIEDSNKYPDYDCRKLRKAIGDRYNLNKEYICCGNGAAELIYNITRAVNPKKAMVLAPTFSDYERSLKAVNSTIDYYRLTPENDFAVQSDIIEKVMKSNPEIVYICNPNNPTGKLTDHKILLELLEATKSIGARLLVDECFIEFTTEKSMAEYVGEYKNLIVLRAFTKTYAMAGIRSGYCMCSDEKLYDKLFRITQNWNVSNIAIEASVAALKEDKYLAKSVKEIQKEAKRVTKALKEMKLKVWKTSANYILLKSDIDLYEECLKRGLLIRDCSNYVGLEGGYYRIAVRTKEENEVLLKVLGGIING